MEAQPVTASSVRTTGGRRRARPSFAVLAAAFVLLLSGGIAVVQHETPAYGASTSDFQVTSYGATGNGTTDDRAAIQSAIDAASAAGGGVVFFPKGTYRITGSLEVSGNNVQLEGTGKASVIFLSTAGGTVIHISNATNFRNTTHNKVVNLTIDRAVAPSATSAGIWVERARFTTLQGVTVFNAGDGIAVGPKSTTPDIVNQHTYILDSYVMRSGSRLATSTFPNAGIIFYSGADYNVHNTFVEPSNRGIVMTNYANGIEISQSSVINGSAYNYGIVSDGPGFARYIENVIIENAHQQQIFIGGTSKNISVTDSWIGAGDELSTRVGIQVEAGAGPVTIANNRIGNQRGSGIVSSGNRVKILGNELSYNVGGGCACDSIQVNGGNHVIIEGNQVESPTDRYGVGVYGPTTYTIYSGNDTSQSGLGFINTSAGPSIANNNF